MDDDDHLRRAFAVARRAGAHGNPPFGAVLVAPDGAVVMEGENNVATERDCTGHAETNLIRAASRRFGPGALRGYVLYASAEPCCMCGVAAYWAGLNRIVYGLSHARLHAMRGAAGPLPIAFSTRELLARADRPIEVVGPLLEDEAAAVFDR
ncbi:MAG: nucleoside deaminase [Rhodospirillales bacterium]